MFSYVQFTLDEIEDMLSLMNRDSNVPVEERGSLVNAISVLRKAERELNSMRRVELEEDWPPRLPACTPQDFE